MSLEKRSEKQPIRLIKNHYRLTSLILATLAGISYLASISDRSSKTLANEQRHNSTVIARWYFPLVYSNASSIPESTATPTANMITFTPTETVTPFSTNTSTPTAEAASTILPLPSPTEIPCPPGFEKIILPDGTIICIQASQTPIPVTNTAVVATHTAVVTNTNVLNTVTVGTAVVTPAFTVR